MKYSSIALAALSTTVGVALIQATTALSALRFEPKTTAPAEVAVPSGSLPAEVVRVVSTSNGPVVLLRPEDSDAALPIWIGYAEARAIERARSGIDMPRPMTHDLFASALGELATKVAHVRVDGLRPDGVYVATVTMVRGDEVLSIDARPSDSIALALRTGAPIFVAAELNRQMVEY